VNGSYRTHGDRFVVSQSDPLSSDNRHRTHAALGAIAASRRLATGTVTAGIEGGGDWIRSSNLGDHAIARGAAFGEWRQPIGARLHLEGALRVDAYEEFGTAWNPSVGASWWPSPAVRVRASGGRAFRIPTFTERYYSDPANLARPEVGPERAWSREAGVDLFLRGWTIQATAFGRSESDVIDWLRGSVQERWRTYNIREIDSAGIELGVTRTFAPGAFVRAGVTLLDLDASSVTQLSKYALDYASRSAVVAGSLPITSWMRLAPRIEYRRRVRSAGGEEYVVVDLRAAVPIGRHLEVMVDGTNLLDRRYQEIAGVPMPGAAGTVSLRISR
jgi:outer membrane cobalamin receptor